MYTIDEKLLKSIMLKKFNTLVGNTCEVVENRFKDTLDKSLSEKLIKEAIRKYAFDSMREIQEQISAFSKGVNININFKKPESQ